MSNVKLVYLGKDGKTFGPYTEADLEKLQDSGEIFEYSWIWESQESGWKPLNAPPPPPPSAPSVAINTQAPAFSSDKKLPPSLSNAQTLQIICFDQKNVFSAKFSTFTPKGATLSSTDFSNSLPPFKKGAKIWLNILNPSTQMAEKTNAKLLEFSRNNHSWEYQIEWVTPGELPSLLKDA